MNRLLPTSSRSPSVLWLGLLALLAALLLPACSSTSDADNLSERPWNSPRSWETGLPAGMMEGR